MGGNAVMEIPVKYWSVNQRKHVGSVEAVLNGYDAHVQFYNNPGHVILWQ